MAHDSRNELPDSSDEVPPVSLTNGPWNEGYERDETYYCQDLVLLVENCLFRVPRRIFEEGELFQDMFSLPPPEGQIIDGMSDQQPLRLPDTYTKADFRRFLKVLLPLRLSMEDNISLEEWVSVLKLSSMWGFATARTLAITNLSQMPMGPIEKIILAKHHDVSQWLVPALNELAQREAPLDMRDASQLEPVVGWDFILKVAQVREKLSQPTFTEENKVKCYGCRNYSAWCQNCSGQEPPSRSSYDYKPFICTVFGLAD